MVVELIAITCTYPVMLSDIRFHKPVYILQTIDSCLRCRSNLWTCSTGGWFTLWSTHLFSVKVLLGLKVTKIFCVFQMTEFEWFCLNCCHCRLKLIPIIAIAAGSVFCESFWFCQLCFKICDALQAVKIQHLRNMTCTNETIMCLQKNLRLR